MTAMTRRLARGTIACLCAIFVWASPLAAGRLAAEPRTNQGAKYQLDTGTKFHTNPGGKYVFSGQASKFHTNPGGKYVYRGYSAAPR